MSNAKRTVCPVSREQFVTKAKPVAVLISGVPMVATQREFSTGSVGWYLNGKTVIEVDGVPVAVQVGVTLTAIGSKPDA